MHFMKEMCERDIPVYYVLNAWPNQQRTDAHPNVRNGQWDVEVGC